MQRITRLFPFYIIGCNFSQIIFDESILEPQSSLIVPKYSGLKDALLNKGSITLDWTEDSKLSYSASLNGKKYMSGAQLINDGYYIFCVFVLDPRTKESESTEFILNTNFDIKKIQSNEGNGIYSVSFLLNTGFQFDLGKDPQYAIWIDDENGLFLQNLFVCESPVTNRMRSTSLYRANPQALPYWSNKACEERDHWISTSLDSGRFLSESDTNAELDSLHFSIPLTESEGPIPSDLDEVTGATIYSDFTQESRLMDVSNAKIRVLFEINRSYDSNNYYNTTDFNDDKYFYGSKQFSLIYSADVDLSSSQNIYELELTGAGHYTGRDGNLYSTEYHTSALELVDSLYVISH